MGTKKCEAARGFTNKSRASTSKHPCNQAATNIMATEHKHGHHNPSITISKPCTKLDTVWAHKRALTSSRDPYSLKHGWGDMCLHNHSK